MKKETDENCPDCGTQHGSKNECPAGSSNTGLLSSPLVLLIIGGGIAYFYATKKKKDKNIAEDKAIAMGAEEQSFEPVSFGLN
tara:strand:+ start:96 stop:344 length:249 start_codon:yes stop_codon:yes gene_type:complete